MAKDVRLKVKEEELEHFKKAVRELQSGIQSFWDFLSASGWEWKGVAETPEQAMKEVIDIAIAKDRAERAKDAK